VTRKAKKKVAEVDMHMPPQLQPLAVAIETLKPDPMNARAHDRRNLDAVKQSLQQFGWRNLIVVQASDMTIVAGHARVQAARELGWTHVPALLVSEERAKSIAFAIADNRTAELATWDLDNLSEALALVGIDDVPGFTAAEIESMLATPLLGSADETTVQSLNDQGQKSMVARNSTAVLRVQVPRTKETEARAALQAAVAALGGTVL